MRYEYMFELDPEAEISVMENEEERYLILELSHPLSGVAHPDRSLDEVTGEVAQAYLGYDGLSLISPTPANPSERA